MVLNHALFNVGIKDENLDYLNEKIQATNFLCFFFGLLSIPFFFITYKYIPEIAFLPALFFVVALIGIFLNYIYLPNLARFMVCFGFIALYTVYTSYITPDHEPLLASFLAMQVLFLLPPWILFDLEEKNSLIAYSVAAIAFTLLTPYFNNLLTHEVKPEVIELFKSGWLFYLCLITALLGMSGALLFLEYSTFITGNKNALLLGEMSEKASQIAMNEKKLSDYIAEIEASKQEGERRQWASNGIAKFADILRNSATDDQKMFDVIISNLVKYIGANQGGLFLLEGEKEERVLNLVAAYAYDRKKYLQKTIAVGEGVLGQVVLEKSPVFMTAIPDEYVVITSGLGDAPPRSLLISPLIVNEEVYGVLELASFKKFEPHVQEFVSRIGESIASTIANVRVSGKTKTLLEELQQQTEEMKSQEEEMRQNMEELVATQEEMQRKEQEYLQRIADLEQNAGSLNEVSR
jgi:putative methionine-R-sulfoxide reductase with GAF domain